MDETVERIEGEQGGLLIVADHAGGAVPEGIDLGVAPALLGNHIAVDIGVAPLAHALAGRLSCPAAIARLSRLVVDLNRDPDEANVVPALSDGHRIAGNEALDAKSREMRLARYWWPYHEAVAALVERNAPRLILNLHSFTPRLASRPEERRPWEIGLLYNRDDRAARLAIPLLRAEGIVTGDNQPYSGRLLNATMNRHAESRGIAYLGIEVRQDLIDSAAGVARWCDRLAPIVGQVAAALA